MSNVSSHISNMEEGNNKVGEGYIAVAASAQEEQRTDGENQTAASEEDIDTTSASEEEDIDGEESSGKKKGSKAMRWIVAVLVLLLVGSGVYFGGMKQWGWPAPWGTTKVGEEKPLTADEKAKLEERLESIPEAEGAATKLQCCERQRAARQEAALRRGDGLSVKTHKALEDLGLHIFPGVAVLRQCQDDAGQVVGDAVSREDAMRLTVA